MKIKREQILSTFIYIALFLIFLLTLFFFLPSYKNYNRMKKDLAELNRELSRKTEESIRLQREVHDLERNPAAIEKVAREKYELCREGEIILKYE